MRPLALYLPQYHAFKENDEWWGKGYTEWTAVRNARPLFNGHVQPREPYDGIYYDLSDPSGERLRIQADMAREYGLYGFVFYQYYFTGRRLMERPMEILLSHPEIDMRYCICWANESWRRAWYDYNEELLLAQEYGGEAEWRTHFDCLLKYFKDERYIRIDGRPMLCIYRPFEIDELPAMRGFFDRWAKEAGFPGIYLVGGKTGPGWDTRNICDAYYYFEPGYSLKHGLTSMQTFEYNVSTALRQTLNSLRGASRGGDGKVSADASEDGGGSKSTDRIRPNGVCLERRIPIDRIYDAILRREYADNEYPGIIARWDNTPRRGYKGLIYTGASPERFYSTLCKLDEKIRKDAFVFINAWNEWGEGAMLEPDRHEGYVYLEALKKAVNLDMQNNTMP